MGLCMHFHTYTHVHVGRQANCEHARTRNCGFISGLCRLVLDCPAKASRENATFRPTSFSDASHRRSEQHLTEAERERGRERECVCVCGFCFCLFFFFFVLFLYFFLFYFFGSERSLAAVHTRMWTWGPFAHEHDITLCFAMQRWILTRTVTPQAI